MSAPRQPLPSDPPGKEVLAENETDFDARRMTEFMSRALVALDGLWFMNVMRELGARKTLEMDVDIIAAHLKIAVRLWREIHGHQPGSIADKVESFRSHAFLFGHRYEIFTDGDGQAVTMRLHRCGIYENLKRTGRADQHDCRVLCRRVAPTWFAEMEPRTGGRGRIDLRLPVGGPCCDWKLYQLGDDGELPAAVEEDRAAGAGEEVVPPQAVDGG